MPGENKGCKFFPVPLKASSALFPGLPVRLVRPVGASRGGVLQSRGDGSVAGRN